MLETFGSPWKLVGAIFGSFASLLGRFWPLSGIFGILHCFFLDILLTESLHVGIIRSVSVPRSGTDGQAMVRKLQTRDGRQATNRHWTDERQMADRPETDEGQTSDGRVTDDSQMADRQMAEDRQTRGGLETDEKQTTHARYRGTGRRQTDDKQTMDRRETEHRQKTDSNKNDRQLRDRRQIGNRQTTDEKYAEKMHDA